MTIAKARPAESATNPFTTPSPKLWRQGFTGYGSGFPSINIVDDPADKIGQHIFEDFWNFTTPAAGSGVIGPWTYFMSATATLLEGGIGNLVTAAITSTTTLDDVTLARLWSLSQIAVNSGRPIYFETRMKFGSVADGGGAFFAGLFAPIVPTTNSHLASTTAFADSNFIGFARLSGDDDDLLFVYKATGQTLQQSIAFSPLVANAWYKFGFEFDGVGTIRIYVNGQEIGSLNAPAVNATQMAAVTFPSAVPLCPTLVVKNLSATPGSVFVNWIRFGQVKNAADGYSLLAPQ